MQDYDHTIIQFRTTLQSEFDKAKEKLTKNKSKDFFSDFEHETDRLDAFASEHITKTFAKLPTFRRYEEGERIRQALLQVNIHVRNEFRKAYMEMRDANGSLS